MCRFLMSFGLAKSLPKIDTNDGIWRLRDGLGDFLGGSASRAVVLGGVSRVVLLVLGTSFGKAFGTPSPPS